MDDAEKARIIEGYRTKLGSMDCRYFDFGEGTCPFGTSCFYRCAGRCPETYCAVGCNAASRGRLISPPTTTSWSSMECNSDSRSFHKLMRPFCVPMRRWLFMWHPFLATCVFGPP